MACCECINLLVCGGQKSLSQNWALSIITCCITLSSLSCLIAVCSDKLDEDAIPLSDFYAFS